MILINNKTNEVFTGCWLTFIAETIGVNRKTVKRWHDSGRKKETYNQWTMYFKVQEVKQKKGFMLHKWDKRSQFTDY